MQELCENEDRMELLLTNNSGSEITTNEVRMAVKPLDNNKAVGPDQVHGEILK